MIYYDLFIVVVYGKNWTIDDFDLKQNLKHDSVDGDGGL